MIKYTGNPRTLYVTREVIGATGSIYDTDALDPRLDVVNHSPTGFAWGYWGSGPAQLAFALLADTMEWRARQAGGLEGSDRIEAALAARKRASDPALYQAFKQDVVGNWPCDAAFEITDAEIIDWLASHEARQ